MGGFKKGNNLGKRWTKGKSGNPNGRPRKLVKDIIKDFKEKGITRVTAADVAESFEHLFNADEAELKAIEANKGTAILIKIIARALLNKTLSRNQIELMLDRVHGTAKASEAVQAPTTLEWVEEKTYVSTKTKL